MLQANGSEILKTMLCDANRMLRDGRSAEAHIAYQHLIDIDMPLCRHRRRFLAAAHLGRAAILIDRDEYRMADEEIRLASVIYEMDGDHTMGERTAALSDFCDIAIHTGDTSELEVVWSQYHDQLDDPGADPIDVVIGLLTDAVMRTINTHQAV